MITSLHVVLTSHEYAFSTVQVHVYTHTVLYVKSTPLVGFITVAHVHRSSSTILNPLTLLYVHVTVRGEGHAFGVNAKLKSPHTGVSS